MGGKSEALLGSLPTGHWSQDWLLMLGSSNWCSLRPCLVFCIILSRVFLKKLSSVVNGVLMPDDKQTLGLNRIQVVCYRQQEAGAEAGC